MSAEHEIAERAAGGEPRHDGIGEEDNPIPGWWWWSFIATVLIAAFYMPYYTLSGWSQEREYAEQVEAAAVVAEAARASLPTANPFTGDAAALAEGKQTWDTICVACHKPDGSGLVGPSLVDPYWKYGSEDTALFETVAKGRPGGMPAWEAQLGTEKIWKVLAYMRSLPQSEQPGMGAPGVAGAAAPAAAPAPAPPSGG
jgi:cytochrome c oxidase cbb3-type subunit 3